MAEFNLIKEPWIPCIDLDGNLIEYGIRDMLLKAHKLREICDGSPLVTVAIHRLLLAILYRAFEGPTGFRDWKKLFQSGSFVSHSCLHDYLTRWHDRFFLFDEAHPFLQIAQLDLNEYKGNGEIKTDKTDGLMRLAAEAPDKGGRILFDHRIGTERPTYESSYIAKMILSAQSFEGTGVASSGKIGNQEIKPSNCQFAPCVDGLCLWLQGDRLFQTLMLNLVPHPFNPKDLPAWEDDNLVTFATKSWTTAVSFTGPIQRFTSASRFIRVIDHKSMFFTNGMKTASDFEDPMKAYARETSDKPWEPIELRKDKAAWRDAFSLLAINTANHKPPESLNHAARLVIEGLISAGTRYRSNVVGLAKKQGKSLLWRHERMPVPAALLNSVDLIGRLGSLLKYAENAASELKTRSERISRLYLSPEYESPGGRKPDPADVNKMVNTINPLTAYWSRLEEHFPALLENLPNDWDYANSNWKQDDQQTATLIWREHVKREAQRALEESIRSLGTTARAIQAIAPVRTDFNDDDLNPPLQTAYKQKRKAKGGKKK